VAFDSAKEKHAVAIAEDGRDARSRIDAERVESLSVGVRLGGPQERLKKLSWEGGPARG